LIVDPDAVLSDAVSSQAFQSVPLRAPKVFKSTGRIQDEKLPVGLSLQIGSQPWNSLPFEDPLRQGVPEAADHGERLRPVHNNVKRYYPSAG
jgi:hypothetical protein